MVKLLAKYLDYIYKCQFFQKYCLKLFNINIRKSNKLKKESKGLQKVIQLKRNKRNLDGLEMKLENWSLDMSVIG